VLGSLLTEDGLPLLPGGESGPAAAPEAAAVDLVADRLGRHVVERLAQRRVASPRDVLVQVHRVDLSAELQHVVGLQPVEGDLVLRAAGAALRAVEQALHHLVALQRALEDLLAVLQANPRVEHVERLNV